MDGKIIERIEAAYRAWNISEQLPQKTTPALLAQMLSSIEPKIGAGTYRIFSSSFDPSDPALRAFPRPINSQWASLERTLRFWGATVVMTRLPHFWQLESPAHAACRNVDAPIFTNEVENMPVGGAAILSAGVDAIVSDATSSFGFTSHLLEKKVPLPPLWILIHDVRSAEWNIPAPLGAEHVHVASEVHIFPGVPLLEQCPLLVAMQRATFHATSAYALEMEGKETLATSIGDDPFPLYRFVIPALLKETGMCGCGRTIIERA